MKSLLSPKGILWLTYPKATSKIKVDINRDTIREHSKLVGLEAVGIFAVGNEWSALRLKLVGRSEDS